MDPIGLKCFFSVSCFRHNAKSICGLFWYWQSLCRWWLSGVLLVRSAAAQPPPESPERSPLTPPPGHHSTIHQTFLIIYFTKNHLVWPKWEMKLIGYLISLKVDIAQMQDGGKHSKDGGLVLWAEAKDFHGWQQTPEVIRIVFSHYSAIPPLREETSWQNYFWSKRSWSPLPDLHLIEIVVGFRFLQIEGLSLLRRKTCQHLIENVIVPLIFGLKQTHVCPCEFKFRPFWSIVGICLTWNTIRDFSSRYWEVMAPQIIPLNQWRGKKEWRN